MLLLLLLHGKSTVLMDDDGGSANFGSNLLMDGHDYTTDRDIGGIK